MLLKGLCKNRKYTITFKYGIMWEDVFTSTDITGKSS